MFSLQWTALAAVIVIVSVLLGAGLYAFGVSGGVSLIVALSALSHLSLLTLLTRVWLIERFPVVRRGLEQIPGISFPVPVPERFRPQAPSAPANRDDSTAAGGLPVHPMNTQPEPFTLGTLAFEPPEPFPVDLPEPPQPEEALPSAPMSVSVFERAWQKSTQARKATPYDRLVKVCKVLKQCNLEVNVWTEDELQTLANHMLGAGDDEARMASLLLPQNVVKLAHHRTDEFEHHAGVLTAMLSATSQRWDVAFVNSTKDAATGNCVVNFEFQGRPVCWRFTEPENRLSKSFLKTLQNWIRQHSAGEFRLLAKWEGQTQLIYLPMRAWQAIQPMRSNATQEYR